MRPVLVVVAIAAVIIALSAGWQICACEMENAEFQDDLQDLASQPGAHIGLAAPNSDADLRAIIIRKALGHGIELAPAQVSIQHTGSGVTAATHLPADYTVSVDLFVTSVNLHFAPSVNGKTAGAAGVAVGA
jgi:hypothetical protein